MTKTKKNTIFLSLIALLLAVVSAALLFAVAPKRVNAEEEKAVPTVIEETKHEKYRDIWEHIKSIDKNKLLDNSAKNSSETLDYSTFIKITEPVSNPAGKIVAVEHSDDFCLEWCAAETGWPGHSLQEIFTTPYFTINSDNYNSLFAEGSSDTVYVQFTLLTDEERALFMSEEDFETYTCAVYVPSVVISFAGNIYNVEDVNFSPLYAVDRQTNEQLSVVFYELSAVEPTEPEQPDNPSDNPTPTETNTDEKKPFDLGEWLANAGDDVSAWLGDNVGIDTSGSTVLIVGAVIIVVILARRRRR